MILYAYDINDKNINYLLLNSAIIPSVEIFNDNCYI